MDDDLFMPDLTDVQLDDNAEPADAEVLHLATPEGVEG